MKSKILFLSVAAVAAIGGATLGADQKVPEAKAAPAPAFAPKRFSVVVKGSGPDVILIPGLASSRDVWSGTVAAVPGYRYHLVQVAGFAGEPVRGNAQGQVVAPLADEIARYITAKGLKRPAIVGHSMGGTVAMMIAARHPAVAEKVMVVDMLPEPAGLLGSSAMGVRGLADSLRDITATPGGRQLVASLVGMFGNGDPDTSRSDSDVVARATHELATIDLRSDLGKMRTPLTVVYATPDRQSAGVVDRSYRGAYAAKKDAQLVRIDRSGHMIMYDQPRAFRAALEKFLKS